MPCIDQSHPVPDAIHACRPSRIHQVRLGVVVVHFLAENRGDLSGWLRGRTYSLTDVPASGAPKHWSNYTAPYLVLDKLNAGDRMAIELWMNEDIERQWLEGELTLLEREWRQAEELAKISDGLALPE